MVESLAWQLSQHTGEPILLTSSAAVASAATAEFWEPQMIQRLVAPRDRQTPPLEPCADTLRNLRRKFGFVLVDCPALRESADILTLPKICEGVVLVVAAGETKAQEVE